MAESFVRHELAVFSLPIASCEVCGRFFGTNTLFDSNTPSPPFFFEKRFALVALARPIKAVKQKQGACVVVEGR